MKWTWSKNWAEERRVKYNRIEKSKKIKRIENEQMGQNREKQNRYDRIYNQIKD